jgi:predicted nuclease of restriction endonuclease-like (RecB) superfamily
MNFDQLITQLQSLDGSLKQQVAQTANVALTLRNWLVGAYIIEFEQNGEERAKYGERLLPKVETALKIKGLTRIILQSCRLHYLAYPQICQTASDNFSWVSILGELHPQIPQSLPAESSEPIPLTLSVESARPDFALPAATLLQKLSFSHFVELLRIADPLQRAFYEIECVKGGWSVRELKRQVGSLLFERLGLSTDQDKLLRLTHASDAPAPTAADVIKDPYVFEFLGLQPKEVLREHDLETALLDHLQEFLLELGLGFCFEDRQKKIRIGQRDYFIDLVFYHRKLHCHVLIELKVEPFDHGNAGQLNTYLNYYKRHEMAEGDNPPIGLLLCTDKDHALVEYALGGMDENLFVSAYKVALPDRATLEQTIRDTTDQFKPESKPSTHS